MMASDEARPWEALQRFVAAQDHVGLERYLDSLGAGETARAISRLAQEDQTRLFLLLSPEEAAEVLEEVSDAHAAELVEDLPPAHVAAIVDEMASDRQADLLGELDAQDAEAILREMEPEDARDVRRLLAYPPDSAGGMMITEYLSYRDDLSVADVLADMRAERDTYAHYEVQYAYVVAADGRLRGVVPMRDLLFASGTQPVVDVMRPDPLVVRVHASFDELREFFDLHGFLGVPVVDVDGRLVGLVRRHAVQEEVDERTANTFLRFVGIVGREELRTMPLAARSSRRLSWLSINIVLNLAAASVIALYQDTLAQAIVLAVFLPIISDMSGCSGNQAVAVSIRELTLGFVKPFELGYVLLKEVSVGLINGVLLGLMLGLAALLWKGNPYLGFVVGGALALNTLVAVALGGLLPLLLRSLRFDAALASGPILTTVTDMCGFFILLSLATQLLPRLAA